VNEQWRREAALTALTGKTPPSPQAAEQWAQSLFETRRRPVVDVALYRMKNGGWSLRIVGHTFKRRSKETVLFEDQAGSWEPLMRDAELKAKRMQRQRNRKKKAPVCKDAG
jgi:hypothetical protein